MKHVGNISTYISPSEAARRLLVSVGMVSLWMKAGRLGFVPTANGRLLDPDAVEHLRLERAAAAAERESSANSRRG